MDASLLAANVPWFVSLWPFRLAKGVWGFDAGILTYFRLPRRLCCAHSVLSVAPFLEFERKSKGERDPTICPRVRIPMHWVGFRPTAGCSCSRSISGSRTPCATSPPPPGPILESHRTTSNSSTGTSCGTSSGCAARWRPSSSWKSPRWTWSLITSCRWRCGSMPCCSDEQVVYCGF